MIRVRTLRMVSDLRPARLALSGALSRRSRELIEHSRRRMHDGHGWRDAGSRLEPHRPYATRRRRAHLSRSEWGHGTVHGP